MTAPTQPKPTTERVGGNVDTPAKIVEEALRMVQVSIDLTMRDEDTIPSDDPRWIHVVGRLVSDFGVAFLMETLRRTNPAVADAAARELWAIWDAGDSIGELTWEWRQQIAAGQPIDSGRGGEGYIFGRLFAPAETEAQRP